MENLISSNVLYVSLSICNKKLHKPSLLTVNTLFVFKHTIKMHADTAAPKKLNGLTKPLDLSLQLTAIVGARKDEKLARSEIVKRLWAYLKAQNLQDPTNKQFFTPDKHDLCYTSRSTSQKQIDNGCLCLQRIEACTYKDCAFGPLFVIPVFPSTIYKKWYFYFFLLF